MSLQLMQFHCAGFGRLMETAWVGYQHKLHEGEKPSAALQHGLERWAVVAERTNGMTSTREVDSSLAILR
jgi:hypothetical protein